MPFDPNQPYQVINDSGFDSSKPYQIVSDGNENLRQINIGNPIEAALPLLTGTAGGLVGTVEGLGQLAYEKGRSMVTGDQFDPKYAVEQARRAQQQAQDFFQLTKTGSINEQIGENIANVASILPRLGGQIATKLAPNDPVSQYLAEQGGQLAGGALTGRVAGRVGKAATSTKDIVTGEPLFTPENMQKIKDLQPVPDVFTEQIDTAPKITPSGVDISPQDVASQDSVVTPKMAERAKVLASIGNDEPSRFQLTQKNDHDTYETEMVKSDNPVAELYARQSEKMAAKANQVADSYGGNTSDALGTGASVAKAVESKFKDFDETYQKEVDAVKNKLGDNPVVAGWKTSDYLNNAENDFTSDVKKYADWAKSNLSDKLLSVDKDGVSQPYGNRMSVTQAENFRKKLNEKIGKFMQGKLDPTGYEQLEFLNGLKKSLTQDVLDSTGEDSFKQSRQIWQDRMNSLEVPKKNIYDTNTRASLVERILTNQIPESAILDEIRKNSTRPEDVQHLRDFLVNKAGPEGIQAWKNIQSQMIREAAAKATGAKIQGVHSYSPSRFAGYFDPIARTGKIDTILGDGKQFVENSRVAGELMKNGVRPSPSGKSISEEVSRLGELWGGMTEGHPIGEAIGAPLRGISRFRNAKEIKNTVDPLKKTREVLNAQ